MAVHGNTRIYRLSRVSSGSVRRALRRRTAPNKCVWLFQKDARTASNRCRQSQSPSDIVILLILLIHSLCSACHLQGKKRWRISRESSKSWNVASDLQHHSTITSIGCFVVVDHASTIASRCTRNSAHVGNRGNSTVPFSYGNNKSWCCAIVHPINTTHCCSDVVR